MQIERMNHVQISVPVNSEDEVRRFYSGVLGLREVPKPAALQQRGGLWLDVGNDQLLHFGTEDVVDRAASKRHVAFEVIDLNEARRELEAAGIRVVESIPIPGCDRFEFRDPFGNRVELMELRR
jgi:catechol 2,3-dioxygenase-like lactoylglutathione lyase family enzyme